MAMMKVTLKPPHSAMLEMAVPVPTRAEDALSPFAGRRPAEAGRQRGHKDQHDGCDHPARTGGGRATPSAPICGKPHQPATSARLAKMLITTPTYMTMVTSSGGAAPPDNRAGLRDHMADQAVGQMRVTAAVDAATCSGVTAAAAASGWRAQS